jgi:peptidyl-prolyl cis-trans isomerase SurA
MKLANIVFSAIALMLLSEMPLAQNKNRSIDEVIAVVDTSLVTKLELENRIVLIEKQFKAANRALPPANELRTQVLERLISERIQQNLARETGINVSDKDLERILENIAAQGKLSVAELKIKVEKEGTAFNKYKEEIRKEVQAARLRERDVDARVKVTESEIDSYISEKNRGKILQAGNDEIYLAQLVVGLPANPSESDIATAKTKAEDVLKQASIEKDFLAYQKSGHLNRIHKKMKKGGIGRPSES